jgi:hypothetical protein
MLFVVILIGKSLLKIQIKYYIKLLIGIILKIFYSNKNMELIQAVLLLCIAVCLFEWDHLRRNNVRYDEHKYLYFAIVLILILIVTLFNPDK